MKLNKGAMFGLDSRIALAIFGALSVISGAALYSAIQNAKVTSLITELNEVGKSIEAYLLDTGTNLPRVDSDTSSSQHYRFKTVALVENPSVAGWQGPYLSYAKSGDFLIYAKEESGLVYAYALESEGALGGANDYGNVLCNASNKVCSVWVSFWGFKTSDILKILDDSFDNGDGDAAGKIRWTTTGSGATLRYRLLYRYMPLGN